MQVRADYVNIFFSNNISKLNERLIEMNDEENLDFDALTYGITEGGLRSTLEINLLICYVVVNSKKRLTDKIIIDTMVEGEIANYFETANALERLKKKKIIVESDEGFLLPGKNCKNLMDLVENDLPFTIRKKSINLSAKLAVKELYRKENNVETEKTEDGYKVTMHIKDLGKDFMSITLHLPTSAQADMVKERFYDNPVRVYDAVLEALFKEDEEISEEK